MSTIEKKPSVRLADPPRDVPWLVCLVNLCGGFANMFGWTMTGLSLGLALALPRPMDADELTGPIVGAILILFLAVGLGFLVIGLRLALKTNRLLATGNLAMGRLKAAKPTNACIGGMRVWRLTFEFESADGVPYEVVHRRFFPKTPLQESMEYVVYEAFDPSCAVVLHNMPWGVTIDDAGRWQSRNRRWAMWVVLRMVFFLAFTIIMPQFIILLTSPTRSAAGG